MDLYNLVLSAKLQKGGGGDEPVLIDKTITANGTYNASSDNADGYKKVVANVPSVTPTGNINITSTAQTDVSAYATAQVVDADLVASNIKKDVDILGVVGTYEGGGGGGGGGLTLLASEEVTIETASSTATVVKEIPVNESDYLGTKLLLVLIYDKAGFSLGHCYSTINLIQSPTIQDKSIVNYGVYLNGSNRYAGWVSSGGVYISSVARSSGVSTLKISAKQNSASGTVTGSTYAIKVYAVDVPSNFAFPS